MILHMIFLLLLTTFAHGESSLDNLPAYVDDDAKLQSSEFQNSSCPTWMNWSQKKGRCKCESDYIESFVFCSDHSKYMQVWVLHGYCMTPTKFDNQTFIVGSCPYNIVRFQNTPNNFYYQLPLDRTQVESAMCGKYNRRGQLCGECIEHHSLPVYTYHPQCVNCKQHASNWGKYLAFSLAPQTVFCIIVLSLRFRGMSPHVNGFILYSQLITPPPVLRAGAILLYNFREDDYNPDKTVYKLIHAAGTFHSIWNMDFFRYTYSPFCLHPNASALQILALDYIIAVYPLLLIALIYLLVKLYYQNWTPIVLLWKPFQRCSTWFNRQCNIQASLVDAFATFLQLSYIKFLSVSFTLLFPAMILDTKDEFYSPSYLYYASTMEYLGSTHMFYFLLAVLSLLTFTLLPILLLCLYPCQWFQRCLNHFNLSSHALHIFMDTFQGSYKNGMNGTKDYRFFAAGNLILMVAVYMSLIGQMIVMKFWATVFVVFVYTGAFAICRPFKQDRHNKLHIMWLLLVLIFYSVTMPSLLQQNHTNSYLGSSLATVYFLIPPLCVIYVGVRLTLSFFKHWKHYWLNVITRWGCIKRQEPHPEDMAPLLSTGMPTHSYIAVP